MAIGPIAIAIGSNTGKAIVRKGIYSGISGKVAAIERQQPLPVPLGGVAVVDRPLREGEAVMRAGIDLDLVFRSLHALLDLPDDLGRRVDFGVGAGERHFGP